MTAEDKRSLMARFRSQDTHPEMLVRRALHRHGLRFRLHRKDLPGRPDIVLPKHNRIIFVHGCFWHRHTGCKIATTPKTRTDFWDAKFARNMARDLQNTAALEKAGWTVHVVWECEARKADWLDEFIKANFL